MDWKIYVGFVLIGIAAGSLVTIMFIEDYYSSQADDIIMQLQEEVEEIVNITFNEVDDEEYISETICYDNTPSFLKIARNISKNEYIPHVYDCTQFSTDLTIRLRGLGWKVRPIVGFYYGVNGINCTEFDKEEWNCKHEWVILEVPIEAVTGEIIEPDYYREYYSLKEKV